GVDHFPSNVRAAKEHYKLPNIEQWIPGSPLPFGTAQYDIIVSDHQVTHAPRPRQFLAEVRSRLAPGGSLLIYDEPEHLWVFSKKRLGARGINNFHKQLLTRRSFHNLFRLAGFAPVESPRIEYVHENGRIGFFLRMAPALDPKDLPPADPSDVIKALHRWGR